MAPTEVSTRRPWLAAVLSVLVPGAGQFYAGARRRSLWFAIPFAAALAVGVWLLLQGRIGLVSILVRPGWLIGLSIANVAVAVLRIWAAVDAYFVAGGRWRTAVAAATAGFVLFAMTPHAVAGAYAADLLGLLRTVFVTDEPVAAAAAHAGRYQGMVGSGTAFEPASVTTGDPNRSIVVLDDGILLDQPDGVQRRVTPHFGQIPPANINPFEEEVDRITVLLAGGDAGPGRSGERTDVMIVASLDVRTGTAALFSVSRELVGFPLPSAWDQVYFDREEYFWELARRAEESGRSRATDPPPEEFEPTGIWPDRINAIYPYTRDALGGYYPLSPDPGMDALADTLEIALGMDIPYWILVDMQGFVDLVNAIGGVDVTSPVPMHVVFSPEREGAEDIEIEISAGRHHLDGRLALAYVRNRSDSSDYERTRRQRCLLQEVALSLDPLTVLARFGAITDAIERNATSNIPLRFLPDLVEAVGELDRDRIVTMAFQASARHAPDSNYRGLRIIDVNRVRQTVDWVLGGMTTGALPDVEDECP